MQTYNNCLLEIVNVVKTKFHTTISISWNDMQYLTNYTCKVTFTMVLHIESQNLTFCSFKLLTRKCTGRFITWSLDMFTSSRQVGQATGLVASQDATYCSKHSLQNSWWQGKDLGSWHVSKHIAQLESAFTVSAGELAIFEVRNSLCYVYSTHACTLSGEVEIVWSAWINKEHEEKKHCVHAPM